MFRPLTTGVAALVEALTFIVGFALYATLLSNYTTGDPTAAESAAFLAEHETTFYLWNIVIFIVFGIVLVVLGLGLHEMLRGGAPALAQVATAFALIWAGLVIATGMIANIGISTVTALRETEPALAPESGRPSTRCRTGWAEATRWSAGSGCCSSASPPAEPTSCPVRWPTWASSSVRPVW